MLLSTLVFSQIETSNWYFGQNSGLNFKDTQVTVLNDGAMVTPAGCSSISDRNGELLFYTNGQTVWNRNHEIMENGEGLAAEIENIQSTIIVPVPGNDNRYYIFCTKTNPSSSPLLNYGLYYGQVEFSPQKPLGEVTTRISRISNANTGRITAIHHIESESIKVITFGRIDANTDSPLDTFYVFNVDSNGLDRFPIATITIPEDDAKIRSDKGAMKISPDGKKIALADAGSDNIYVFDFDINTSQITYDLGIKAGLLFDPLYSHSVEFSQDSRILYFTGNNFGNTSFLYKYLIYDTNPLNEKIRIDASSSLSYGDLQLASNGKIYIAIYENTPWDLTNFGTYFPPIPVDFISVINDPEDTDGDGNSELSRTGINLKRTASLKGLPNFVASFLRNRIITEDKCVDEFFDFTTDSYMPIDTIFWDFGDGATSTELTPTHQFTTSGIYVVNATITYKNIPYLIQKRVEVYPKPILNPNEIISQCDTDFDGVSLFNLENIGDRVLNQSKDYEYYFYNTYDDALNDNNLITNPENYVNTSSLEELFVKITTPKGCYIISNFFIETSNSSLQVADNIYTCEDSDNATDNDLGRFNLETKASEIITQLNLPAASKITFHTSFDEAQTKLNTLPILHDTTSTTLWFRIETPDNNCGGIGSFNAIVNEAIDLDIEEVYTICYTIQDGAIFLDGNTENEVWVWKDSSGTIISENSSISISEPGFYNLTAYKTENNLVCSRTEGFQIRLPNPVTFKEVKTENNQIFVEVTGFSTYEYSINGTNFFRNNSNTYTFSNVEAGLYTLTVRDIYNCEAPIEKNVAFIGYPRYFTPNNDGINDIWRIEGISEDFYNTAEIYIYDRYGRTLHFMNLKTNLQGWDGTFNGQRLASNDYWYSATLTDKENNSFTKTGHFSLKY